MRMQPIIVKNAKVMFTNFRGVEKKYNVEGNRNFCLVVDRELADLLVSEGINVRETKPRDDNEQSILFVKVIVRFDYYPPKINIVRHDGSMYELDETNVGELDWMDIEKIDLSFVVNKNTKYGSTSLYLRQMYVIPYEDELENEYRRD